jgi:UDP-glucose 4-epimerase
VSRPAAALTALPLATPGTVMVTGGAGYIGAHVVDLLVADGVPVVVVDDLSSGRPERLPAGVPLVEVDLAAAGAATTLLSLMRIYGVESVVHLAGRKQVAESVARPAWYYRQNVDGLLALHDAMSTAGVGRLVFSSSAAVYGDARPGPSGLVSEDDVAAPISPYGQTKLAGEWLNRAAYDAWGLRSVNLRYFNVAGAARPELADGGAANLIPMVFACLDRGEEPQIFGDDYPTPDGTCVRDFIDVRDLAAAHVAALAYVAGPMSDGETFNVGTGRGASVAEVVETVDRVTGLRSEPVVLERRPGDPACVVADVSRIRTALGWHARHGLDDMVASAWDGWRALSDRDHRSVPAAPRQAPSRVAG